MPGRGVAGVVRAEAMCDNYQVQNFWRFVALVPLTAACESGSGGSDSAQTAGTTVNGATHSASTSGDTSEATVSAASGGTTASATSSVASSSTSSGGSGFTSGGEGGAAGDPGGAGGESSSTGGSPGFSGTPTEEGRANLLVPRQEHGAAALDGEVYVLGGMPSATFSVDAYDPETDTWREVANFPARFHHPNVAVVGGMMYVVGFHQGASFPEADGRVFAYDPAADEWLPRASMPEGTERGASCVATLDENIYVFGGASDVTLPDASVYDTVADEWTPLPPLPAPREHCIAAGIDGKIYIVSGRANSIEGIEVESWVYDPATETYDERAALPTPRADGAGAVLNGRIFVFGGEGNADDPDGMFHDIEAYDPATDTWEEFPDMTFPRHGYAAAVVGDRIYLPGGATAQGLQSTNRHTVFYFDPND